MSILKYKTIGNVNPQGRPRVYFCYHPEDFERYFETVSDEILAKQNCSIWYVDGDTVRDEDFFVDLKQMQLFVMPVTTKLLCTENDALDIDFKFAMDNHIPVLPLMQESGLEELFNKKCGDLQFLDKNNKDATAIGYDEKLQKYLESVLIGDELAEKIRSAFDAYVFLSYRKKDRRYAQELMHLIHKNEFCRDIAIWYDEFLTPGENFNDSIKEALQKSGLFVMTVTPNLVNEDNYIMTTEYPMAKQEGKPILPAELVPTDREVLSKKYADIPNPTDAYNETELSDALLESVKKMAIKENDNSPEHNFFIGLAYLGGVDVEVDYDRAVSLITNAAEEGLVEAVQKLVVIYEKGIGIKCDYQKVIFWQNKLVSLLDSEESRKDSDKTFELMDALWDLGSYYREVGEYANALDAFHKMLQIGKLHYSCTLWCKIHSCFTHSKLKREFCSYVSIAYEQCGNMYERLENIDSAFKYYGEALKLKQINYNPDEINSVNEIFNCYKRIGILQKETGDFDKALHCFIKCLEYGEVIYRLNGSQDQLPYIYNQIGKVYLLENNHSYAVEFWEKAIEISEAIIKSDAKNIFVLLDIVDSYNLIGMEQPDAKSSRDYYFKALQIVNESLQFSECFDVLRAKAATLSFISASFLKEQDFESAEEYELSALKIRKKLYNSFINKTSIRELSLSYMNFGYLCKNKKEFEKAVQNYEKAYQLLSSIKENSVSVDETMSTLLYLMAMVDEEYSDKQQLMRIYDLQKVLVEKHPNNEEFISRLNMISEMLKDK